MELSTFLGSDVLRMMLYDRGKIAEVVVDNLLEKGYEVDPTEIRELIHENTIYYPQETKPTIQGFLSRWEQVSEHFSHEIQADDHLNLEYEDVMQIKDFLAYSLELLQIAMDHKQRADTLEICFDKCVNQLHGKSNKKES